MEEIRLEYSRHYFKRANEWLNSTKILGSANCSVYSSYSAIIHALKAVTILDKFDSKYDSGLIAYFNDKYVKTGIFDAEISKIIDSAYTLRESATYEDFYIASMKDAQNQINGAEKIINTIQPYLLKRWSEIIKEEEKFMDAIFTRVSTRQFEPREVDSKYIIKILRAAMAAPSATNQQPWEFWVTDDKDIISKLANVTPYAKPAANAPVVIVPCYNLDALRVPEMANIDMAIATENILLEAESLGLGAVMLGIAPFEDRMKEAAKILDLPENFRVFTIIPIGWPVNKHPQEDRYEPSRVHVI